MIFLRIYQHLLPRARAWYLTVGKTLRRFFEGLTGLPAAVRSRIDTVWRDWRPQDTTSLDEWEHQWGLPPAFLTDQSRRDRITAAWRATGGQSPRYIQDTLQAAGFNVYLHEWWVPGTNTPRNPLDYLVRGDGTLGAFAQCGEPLMLCGEAFALCGNSFAADGYALVNKVLLSSRDLTSLCGEPLMLCGEVTALSGAFTGFIIEDKQYIIPDNVNRWPFFLYIGGETFPELADVPSARRSEFEALCLQLCPTQLWLGMLINYT